MDINRTNGTDPSRQPTNEEGSNSSSSTSLSIIAVEQASSEGVVTNATRSSIRASTAIQVEQGAIAQSGASIIVQAGASIIVQSGASLILQPGSTLVIQQGANIITQPGSSIINQPEQHSENQPRASVIVQSRQHPITQPRASVIVQPGLVLEPAVVNPNRAAGQRVSVSFQPWMLVDPIRNPGVNAGTVFQSTTRPAFESDAMPGPSRRFHPYERSILECDEQAGPSTAPKDGVSEKLGSYHLLGDAFPQSMKDEALKLYTDHGYPCRQIAKLMKSRYPGRTPSKSAIAAWINASKKDQGKGKGEGKGQGKK